MMELQQVKASTPSHVHDEEHIDHTNDSHLSPINNQTEMSHDDNLTPAINNRNSWLPSSFRNTSRAALLCIAVLVLILLSVLLSAKSKLPNAQNVIIMVGDGFGPAHFTLARAAYRIQQQDPNALLPMDAYLVGMHRTRSADSLVTDSAAGATAFSCGLKTNNKFVGVKPDKVACPTIMEAAAAQGWRVGIVSSSRVTHATPASFTSHTTMRDNENHIANQQITLFPSITKKPIDVILGGGRARFVPQSEQGSCRQDNLDLLSQARDLGYSIVSNKSDLALVTTLPLLGLFAASHMPSVLEQRLNPRMPSLADMTAKALTLLHSGDNEHGFVLLVEGSKIDLAAHVQDSAGVVREALAFQEAFDVVRAFVKDNPTSLVVSTADHETGGLSLNYEWNRFAYTSTFNPTPLLAVQNSTNILATAIASNAEDLDFIRDVVVKQWMGIADATETEIGQLVNFTHTPVVHQYAGSDLERFIAEMINRRANIGFATNSHTGVDVEVFAYGRGSTRFAGIRENSEIGHILADILKLDLNAIAPKLSGIALNNTDTSFRCDTDA